MKELNIIYDYGNGEYDTLRFQNEIGKVYLSNARKPNRHNILTASMGHSEPGDSLLVLEPAVANICDYDIENLKKFRYVFGFAEKAYKNLPENKFIKINYPVTNTKLSFEDIKQYLKPFNKRKNHVVIVANNKHLNYSFGSIYQMRIVLADFLYKNKIDIKWFGHLPLNKPYYKGNVDNKLELLSNSKFTICSENTYDPIYSENYLTEKMPDAWCASSVPIYMGCYNIDEFKFSKNMYIDLRKYITILGENKFKISTDLLEVIASYSETEYTKYLSQLTQNINSENGFHNIITYENVYIKMLEIL
jgi:hypothetical protein